MMKKNTIISILVGIALLLCMPQQRAFALGTGTADDPIVYNVTTAEELQNATTEIRAGDADTYSVINLADDITATGNLTFNRGHVSLVSNGYTLTMPFRTRINVSGNAELSLGNGQTLLTIQGTFSGNYTSFEEPGIIYVDTARVNMYDGVTIQNSVTHNWYGGGVTLYKSATFHMYGGTIKDCGVYKGTVCFGGGVAVLNGSTFIMDDGVIEDCFLRQGYFYGTDRPGYEYAYVNCGGAGVFVANKSYCQINGGVIRNNQIIGPDEPYKPFGVGAGIAVLSDRSSYDVSSRLEINGGLIEKNISTLGGGGIAYGSMIPYQAQMAANITYPVNAPAEPGLFISNTTFKNNTTSWRTEDGEDVGGGGGLFLYNLQGNPVVITDSLFEGNAAVSGYGGAINSTVVYSPRKNNMTISNTEFKDNHASVDGGAIHLYKDTSTDNTFVSASLSNCYIYENAAKNGGGLSAEGVTSDTIDLSSNTSVTFINTVIYNNTATDSADDLYSDTATLISLTESMYGKDGKNYSWWHDIADNRFSLTNKNAYTVVASENENQSLKAYPSAYVVKFEALGAVNPDDQNVEANHTAEVPETPVRVGYEFRGWYTDMDFTTLYDFNELVTEDMTLYAKWEYVSYIDKVVLNKTYIGAAGYSNAGETVTAQGTLKEDIFFTIVPYASFNREVGKSDIPQFAGYDADTDTPATFMIEAGSGTESVNVPVPNYDASGVGDYWYEVQEKPGETAGVNYDITKYYLHIVVTHEDEDKPDAVGVSQTALHLSAPDADGNFSNEIENKVTSFTNKYGAGKLSVNKNITGNMADRTKTFDVVVTFFYNSANSTTCPVTSPIRYTDSGFDGVISDWTYSDGKWNASATITVGLGETITFENIPDGVQYIVAEKDYSADGYYPTYSAENIESGDTINAASVSGIITDDIDSVFIENNKAAAIDVGVELDSLPFMMIIAGTCVLMVLVFSNKRRHNLDID